MIIGTKAVKDPQFVTDACKAFPGKIIVGLDAKDGFVATDGWAEVSTVQATDLAKRFEADGVSAIVYTDIAKDGMMQGCNVEATVALAAASRIPVIASGGIHNLSDIEKLLLAPLARHRRGDHRSGDLRRHSGCRRGAGLLR